MANWVYIIETNCTDPAKEKEVNDFYVNVHMRDVLESPGFLTAKRCVNQNPAPGQGKFISIYEIESDDVDKTVDTMQKNMTTKPFPVRQYLEVVRRTLYSQIGPTLHRKDG